MTLTKTVLPILFALVLFTGCSKDEEEYKGQQEEFKEEKKNPEYDKLKENMPQNPNAPLPNFHILSIDGGGIKGIVPLFFLRELEFRTGVPVYDLFDMFVGTSIGVIIALLFSQRKLTATELLRLMVGPLKNSIFGVGLGFWKEKYSGLRARLFGIPFCTIGKVCKIRFQLKKSRKKENK